MKRVIVGLIVMANIGAASAQPLKWEPATKAEKALVREELDIEPTASVQAIRIDLNSDGKPETILRIQGASFCGSRGCSIEIIQGKKGIGSFVGHDIEPVDPTVRGYRSLKLDQKAVLSWNGKQYNSKK